MAVLKLTLTKQWFDLWFHPDPDKRKNEEYRELKPSWIKKFKSVVEDNVINSKYDCAHAYNGWAFSEKYRNGKREILSIHIGKGREEWGAEPGKDYFVIKLGEIMSLSND